MSGPGRLLSPPAPYGGDPPGGAPSREGEGAPSAARPQPPSATAGTPRAPAQPNGRLTPAVVALVAALVWLSGLAPASILVAQEIPRDEYLRFLPLQHRRLQAATDANRRFHLFGDREAPGYRDRAPRDGIDDRRHQRLERLAVRFSPLLVRNTDAVAVDVRAFLEDGRPLHVDRWRLIRPGGRLETSDTVRTGPTRDSADDRRLRSLLQRYNPYREPTGPDVEPAGGRRFEVLFYDLPGTSPDTWKDAFRERMRAVQDSTGRRPLRVYTHPFVQRVGDGEEGDQDAADRFEFVLQHWFFYPFNDGGNDHEGDWEHMNVVLAPAGAGSTALTPRQVRGILGEGDAPPLGPGDLRIGRVEYYFHGKVMVLDYLDPDVYAARPAWERAVEGASPDRLGRRWLWRRTRDLAHRSRADTAANPHPVGYIGANNKGLDQLLHGPGGSNRDSHGTFPLPGLYKNVGPAGAAEAINAPLNPHWELYDPDRRVDRHLERFDDPDRIRILPDWERVHPLVVSEREARTRWAWLVLPVRWGYPAVESPFAGVVAHAETGNDAPYGPAFSPGWNRTGVTRAQARYDPHKFAGTLPLGWRDSFVNSWGFLNLTLPTLSILPPFDFGWRGALAPARIPFEARHPTYFPGTSPPFRLVGFNASTSVSVLPDNFTLLFEEPSLFDQVQAFIDRTDPESVIENENASLGVGGSVGVEFHIGNRLVSMNQIRRIDGDLEADVRQPARDRVVSLRGELDLWEYEGSLRYNLSTGSFQPFLKAGYGLTWFRVENVTLAGRELSPSSIDWVRQPSIFPPENLLPNTWRVGLGAELIPVRSFGRFPSGIDVGVRTSFTLSGHGLGLGQREEGFSDQVDVSLVRPQIDLGITVTY